MKKIFILVLTFIMIVGLGGCVSTQALNEYNDSLEEYKSELDEVNLVVDDLLEQLNNLDMYDDTSILTQLEALELALQALELRMDNITTSVGLNGSVSYYENVDSIVYTMSLINTSITELKDTFNKDGKAPSYIINDDGSYVSFIQLGLALKLKYFNDNTVNEVDLFDNGTDVFLRIGVTSTMSEEEVLARMLLMIGELRLYAHYAMNCNRVIIHVYRFDDYDHQTKLTINQTVILNSYFEILPEGTYYEDFDMKLESDTELDLTLIEAYYDNFVFSGVFDGYILDYK